MSIRRCIETEITLPLKYPRTPARDVEYAVNKLTEMAVRAMAPAINDPFTAMTCLECMGDSLALFARKGAKCPNIHDRHGTLRLVFDPVTFDGLLSAAFDKLRCARCNNASVSVHMPDIIEGICLEMKSPDARQNLHRHVTLLKEESQGCSLIKEAKQSIRQCRFEALQLPLEAP